MSKPAIWLDRVCRDCGCSFRIRQCVLKTNARGNYCSRSCYWNGLRKIRGPLHRDWRPGKIDDRGPYWKEIRKEVLSRIACCILCGTFEDICVHHVIPYRYTKDNSIENLVPVCTRHHKGIEKITDRLIRGFGTDYPSIKRILWTMIGKFVIVARLRTIRRKPA